MNSYQSSLYLDIRDIILSDHNYTRRDTYGCHLKPTKTLFPPRPTSHTSGDLDVTTVAPLPPPEYDAVKSLELMEECKRFGIFARVPRLEESPDDWEEAIPRAGWSIDQLNLFRRIAKILHADRLARLALQGSWSEPARRRAHVDRSAQRFRKLMAAVSWDVRLTQWLHGLLVEHLDIGYLAAYVDILQTLKVRIPTLIERLLAGAIYGKAPVVQKGMNLLLKRPWDPAVSTVNAQKLGKLPGNAVIVMVPSSLKKLSQPTPRCNLWSSHLSNLATLFTVTPTDGTISSRMTPPAYLEQMVSVTKARLASVRVEYPGRPVVVVGWRSGAAVALQAAATEQVAAAVSLGLATRTVEGPRGDPDDSIYSLTCPVLFVTGEHATTARPEDLEEIRAKMSGPTGLVVVGSSDDCLRMGRRHKIALGVTQSLVDRSVLEAVGEFLADILLQPAADRHHTDRNHTDRYNTDRHLTPAITISRKRRLSTGSSIDSESSNKQTRPETPSKQLRQALLAPYRSPAVNGNASTPTPHVPARRGRKPGTLNRNTRLQKTVKTLQTLSPVKKTLEVSKPSDVMLDVGSMASLAPTGPITRTGTPGSLTAGTPPATASAPLQTFRIQAGRVSTSCAPPADVMPLRLSDTTPTTSFGTSHLLVVGPNFGAINGAARALPVEDRPREPGNPIMTMSPMTPVSRVNSPRASLTLPMRAAAPVSHGTTSPVRVGPRFTIGSSNKIIPAKRNVIMMSDKRVASASPSSSGHLKLTATLKTSPTKLLKSSPVSQMKSPTVSHLKSPTISQLKSPSGSQVKSPTMSRLAITQRYVPTTSTPLQQKPIIVKSRTVKASDESKTQELPLMIVKSRGLEEHDEKPMLYLQRGSGEADVPMVIVKNRAVAETDAKAEAAEARRHLLLKDRSARHLVLASGEEYILQERKPAGPKYVLNYKPQLPNEDEGFIYEVIDA